MTKTVIIGSSIVLLIILSAVFLTMEPPKPVKDYEPSKPTEVVRVYFDSWDKKNWPEMYSTISDSLKKSVEEAKTLSNFKNYTESKNVQNVEILSILEKSNDDATSSIEYSIRLTFFNNSKNMHSGLLNLKFADSDIIKGWKLVDLFVE